MARLPTVSGDADGWGGVLNAYLSVEHNSDGTLKNPATPLTDANINAAATTINGKIARTYPATVGTDGQVLGKAGGVPAWVAGGAGGAGGWDGFVIPTGMVAGTGVSGAVRTANTAALNTAADTARTANKILVLAGTYEIDGTITIECHADLTAAVIHQTVQTVSPSIRVGSATSGVVLFNKTVQFGHLLNDQKGGIGTGWSGSSAGVEASNLYGCQVHTGRITGFADGFYLTGRGEGNVHNHYFIQLLENNKRNMVIKPADTGGWVNENNYYGGRYEHHQGEPAAGTRQVFIDSPTGGFAADNNVWYHASLESSIAEITVDMQVGVDNLFHWCRWEGTSPKVAFGQHTGGNVVNGTNTVSGQPERCINNEIYKGYNAYKITITESANSWFNERIDRNNRRLIGGSNGYVESIENLNDSNEAALVIVPSGTGNKTDPGTARTTAIGARYAEFRAAGDTFPRLQIDGALGRINAGPGNAALDATLQRFGTAGWYSTKMLVAQTGIGVGNAVAATTPGTVVKKMQVFDANGTPIGYIPIYSTIT
ncbi:MAG: hypothetical protein ACR2OE_15290 [Thermomicrobiales bacterium]